MAITSYRMRNAHERNFAQPCAQLMLMRILPLGKIVELRPPKVGNPIKMETER
jgi:hypothetical protein